MTAPTRFALLVPALLFALTGCDVKKPPASAPDAAPPTPAKAAPDPAATPPANPAGATASVAPESAASATPDGSAIAATASGPGPNTSPACEARRAALQSRFAEAARCKSDGECQLFQPGCPFGCGMGVNVSTDVKQLKSEVVAYKSECNDCMYRCRPPSGPGMCKNGACVINSVAK